MISEQIITISSQSNDHINNHRISEKVVHDSSHDLTFVPTSQFDAMFADSDLDFPDYPIDQRYFAFFSNMVQQDNIVYDILLAHKITDSGVPNKIGCRIPLVTGWNTALLDMLLLDYEDREVVDWLTYGFTVSRDDTTQDPSPGDCNHRGATLFPQAIDKYVTTELNLGASIGPFAIPPFTHRIGISPLSTRPNGATHDKEYICFVFPYLVLHCTSNIAQRELFTILIALKSVEI